MKRNFTLFACFLCMLFNLAKAAETEPNNTKAQANTLALNGSNSGKISPAGDQDWWKVTTTADGQLDVKLTPLSGRYTWVYIYDNDGVTLINAANSSAQFTLTANGLAAGTYYLKVITYYATDTSSYTISNTLTTPAQANDAEPDSTKATALVLPLNGSTTGHVGYYYQNHRDSVDEYKLTTNGDGALNITIASGNGNYVWAALYDNDGTTLLRRENTNGTLTYTVDGLAAGTYYIQVYCYYNTQFVPYTLSNKLTKPLQVNDAEPNDTKATSLILPLNSAVTGHTNYYYKNVRDTFDWYKITTNADGRLRLRLTSGNGQYVWAYLFDNNGTTQLNAQNTNGTIDINTDGLAAGTYYVRVSSYYNNGFEPYKLEDSLFTPAEANDNEPNDSKATAQVLAVNSTTTGHTDYYYNNKRDTFDWHKITLPQDGMLKLTLTSGNGQYVWAYLYDNDGTTQLNAQNTNSTIDINTDGLAAGTYYVRVNSYYNNGFEPYTLQATLLTYTYTKDAEPNNAPYQAKTLPVNTATTGHVNFYYNNTRDGADWWKINYTGTGNLSLIVDEEAWKINGSSHYYWIAVYKDTAAAPIYNNNFVGGTTINLSSLAQGYYYVKINSYYSSEFIVYSLTPNFTQSNIAKVQIAGKTIAPDCSSTNVLKVKVTGSKPPYTVQLYRYGVLYSNKTVKNNAAFSFDNLPNGVYKVNAYGDGATGTAFGSVTATFVPVPTTLTVTNIQTKQAKLNWDTTPCPKYYQVQYRVLGNTTWITKKTMGNKPSLTITGLTAATSYEWHVAPVDSANGTSGMAPYSVLDTFTTATSLIATANERSMANENDNDDKAVVTAYPNPATSQFTVQLNGIKTNGLGALWLKDMSGATVWSKQNVLLNSVKRTQVDVSKFAAGMYLLQITDDKNNVVAIKKIIVSR